ncbi:MAG: type III-B CRISPR module-associated protein Cmr5 [Candidatus Aenigmatarchaeota archaeon]
MNQKRIDLMIPEALRLLENPLDSFKVMKKDKYKIHSNYVSAIDAFGPSVIQAGILKTLAFYMKNSEGADKSAILSLIKEVMKTVYPLKDEWKHKNLLEIYIEETKGKTTIEKLRLKDIILEAATACKLAKLSFEKYESKENEEN